MTPIAVPVDGRAAQLRERLREVVELLESIASDRTVLDGVAPEDRKRLLAAVAAVYSPDRSERRRMARVSARQRKAARVRQAEGLRAATGIRSRRPGFHSPSVFPPDGFEPRDVHDGREHSEPRVTNPGSRTPNPESRIPSPESRIPSPESRVPDPESRAAEPQHCYVCKAKYSVIHHFYDQMCPACAALNFAKRTELADLRGRVALLTGGRVKIGYQAGLKLLRCGASLIVTTRFPRDAALRYSRERDFEEWGGRLEIFGLDLRHAPSVEAFCRELLGTLPRLDFIVNNACQTVRRPPEFYAHMMDAETAALTEMPDHVRRLVSSYEGLRGESVLESRDPASHALLDMGLSDLSGLTHAAERSQVALLPEESRRQNDLFPEGRLDQDLQQVDLRSRNSWRLLLADVSSLELIEVQLVNAVAPFIINARLKPLLLRTPGRDKHIVNVSAVEGQFYRTFKTTRHPHTNMAKAALNMMTRTSAADYHADGIHMNSVDTGWVTDEDPVEIAARKTVEQRFQPPLDIVDGAARIVDPIIGGFNTGRHVWGQFLKDYAATDW